MTKWFDNRELALIAMCLDSYMDMPECPETEGIKAEIREIVRKLHCIIETETDDGEY